MLLCCFWDPRIITSVLSEFSIKKFSSIHFFMSARQVLKIFTAEVSPCFRDKYSCVTMKMNPLATHNITHRQNIQRKQSWAKNWALPRCACARGYQQIIIRSNKCCLGAIIKPKPEKPELKFLIYVMNCKKFVKMLGNYSF